MPERITRQIVERAVDNLAIKMGIPKFTRIHTGVSVGLNLERNGQCYAVKVINDKYVEVLKLTNYSTLRDILQQVYSMEQSILYFKFLLGMPI